MANSDRPTVLEIDAEAISYNLDQIQKKVANGVKIMPVIKADAYGIGVANLKSILEKNKIDMVAVAIADEGEELRKLGYKQEIVILNEITKQETEKVIQYNLTPGIAILSIAQELNEKAKQKKQKIKVHVEIDTGMGRVGVQPKDALAFMLEIKKMPHLEIEGIYTHFSSADSDEEYTKQQITKFNQVIQELETNQIQIKYKHAAASGGTLGYEEANYNLVRPGIIVYGYLPDVRFKNKIELKPCAKWVSKVSFLKTVPKGCSISYGRSYITKESTKIATIPVGYADGYKRCLSNKGRVYILGKYAPIIGKVCMDSFMVDVTQIDDVQIGTPVILLDEQHITAEELADKCNTISYEILATIGKRVPRILK